MMPSCSSSSSPPSPNYCNAVRVRCSLIHPFFLYMSQINKSINTLTHRSLALSQACAEQKVDPMPDRGQPEARAWAWVRRAGNLNQSVKPQKTSVATAAVAAAVAVAAEVSTMWQQGEGFGYVCTRSGSTIWWWSWWTMTTTRWLPVPGPGQLSLLMRHEAKSIWQME